MLQEIQIATAILNSLTALLFMYASYRKLKKFQEMNKIIAISKQFQKEFNRRSAIAAKGMLK